MKRVITANVVSNKTFVLFVLIDVVSIIATDLRIASGKGWDVAKVAQAWLTMYDISDLSAIAESWLVD